MPLIWRWAWRWPPNSSIRWGLPGKRELISQDPGRLAHALPIAGDQLQIMLLRDTNVGMAEHLRDGQDIGAVLAAAHQQIDGEGIAEAMAGSFLDARQSHDFFYQVRCLAHPGLVIRHGPAEFFPIAQSLARSLVIVITVWLEEVNARRRQRIQGLDSRRLQLDGETDGPARFDDNVVDHVALVDIAPFEERCIRDAHAAIEQQQDERARAIALGLVELFDGGQDAGDLLGSERQARLVFGFAEAQLAIGSEREVDPAPRGCDALIEEDSEERQVGLAGPMAPARVFFEVLLDMLGADLGQESDSVRFHVTAEVAYNQDVQFHCGGCSLALRGEKGGFGGSECDLVTRLRTYQMNAAVRRLRVGASGEELAALGFGRSKRPGVEGLTDELAAHTAIHSGHSQLDMLVAWQEAACRR